MIDFTKPVQTRDGQPVEIKFTDGRGVLPIAGYIAGDTNIELWTEDGCVRGFMDHRHNLINVPEKRVFKRWANIWETGGVLHNKKELALQNNDDCLATVPITIEYTVGEGLGE